MSYELNHEQARTTALAAKHAVRALALCLTANQREMSAEDVAALAAEMREIFTSSQEVLHEIERATPDGDTASDVRSARYFMEDAARVIAHSYPNDSTPASGNQFTRITEPGEIEALTHGKELVVGGTVYRVCLSEEKIIVSDLPGTTFWSPETFIERFQQSRFGILLRH